MIWFLVIILTSGGSVIAAQQNHDTCLEGVAMANLQSEVKVAYCTWRKP